MLWVLGTFFSLKVLILFLFLHKSICCGYLAFFFRLKVLIFFLFSTKAYVVGTWHFFQPKSTDIFLILHKRLCCGTWHFFKPKSTDIFVISPQTHMLWVLGTFFQPKSTCIFIISPQKKMLWVVIKSIMKTCLYNIDPLKPHYYRVKLGFTGVYTIFLISAQNIHCEYSLEPPQRGGSNEYPQFMF